MREPSIHITKSDFEEILESLDIKAFPVDAFFSQAKRKALLARSIQVTNNKTNKRVTNITLATPGDAALIADIIYATRIKLKHRGVRKMNEADTRNWTLCKKLAQVCNTFCEDFGLETREGFIAYIEIGVKRMTDCRNLLNRLIAMAENISAQYDAQDQVRNDPSPRETQEVHNYYVKRIADATGILETFEDQPEKYVHFIKLKEFIHSKGWDYKVYIDAQFESLAWCNGLPEIETLHSDKAVQRLNKYLYKHKSLSVSQTPRRETEDNVSIWDKMKQQ